MLSTHAASPMRQDRLPSWFILFAVLGGLYISLPFLAPVLMRSGWTNAGKAIYFIYSFFCHQLPERSFFLFGSKFTYSLAEIQDAWQNTTNPLVLRQFVGNPALGWKVAWSDRMVSMFSSLWIFGLAWYPFRRRLPVLPLWGLALFLLPMALDGASHFVSDFWGIGQGFRDTNIWLAYLTGSIFPPTFYAGDGWGSVNSVLRLLTGLFFGLGIVWFGFPYLNETLKA